MEVSNNTSSSVASKLTEFSLKRRITVLVLLLTILVVGLIASLGIPVELFPRGYTGQNLTVFVPWQNSPTQEVLDKIARPLEDELGTVRGIARVSSYSTVGRCNLFLNFKQGTDMDIAYREVRDRIQRARLFFPDDVDRVFIRKEDASGIPVAVVGLAIDPALTDYYELIQRELIQPLERLDGVATVRADGLEEKEILIEVDKKLLESNGINPFEVTQDLRSDNFSMASGNVRDSGKKFSLRSIANYKSLDELENRSITPTVRLKDVARIKYEEPEKRYSVRVNSRPAVALVIMKEGEANTVDVSTRLKATIESIKKNPRLSSIELDLLFNQGEVVQDSLLKLIQGGLIGGTFAALVLFIFLRRFRLTAIITFAIPLSLLMALIVMFFTNESLNILTILALVIAVGMLVDNSIVVAENIHRLHKEGYSRRDACVKGASEIALAITMATLTTIVVFAPVALVEGQGQFFLMRLALPLSVSLISSLCVALVFIPLSVYLTLPARRAQISSSLFHIGHQRINVILEKFYDATFARLNRLYTRTLTFFIGRRLDLVLILAVVYGLSYVFAYREVSVVPQQEEDRSSFQISVEASNEYGFEELGEYFQEIETVMEQKKEEYGLKGYFIFYRSRGGEIQGWFDDEKPKTLGAKEVGDRLLKEIPSKPGIKLFFGRENRAEDAQDVATFIFRIEGDDPDVLDDVADSLRPSILSIDGVVGIRGGEEPAPSEMALVINRERASASSISPEIISGMVGYALRGTQLPKYNDNGREIPVRIRFQESDRESLADLSGFRLPSVSGATLPISALTDARMLNSPRGIFRSNKKINRTLTVELKQEDARLTQMRLMELQQRFHLPEGVAFSTRHFQSFQDDLKNMQMAGALSVVFIYLLMGFLFESFILPLSIIFTIPLAGLGVAWIHRLLGKDLDFLGVVGSILLVGVVVNNGIVLLDYVIRLRAGGMSRTQALLQAAERRFRPISMTALTTIIGMIPLTLSQTNDMGMSYKSFGLTLIGGMTTGTILTLLVVPISYTLFDDLRTIVSQVLKWVVHRNELGDSPQSDPLPRG